MIKVIRFPKTSRIFSHLRDSILPKKRMVIWCRSAAQLGKAHAITMATKRDAASLTPVIGELKIHLKRTSNTVAKAKLRRPANPSRVTNLAPRLDNHSIRSKTFIAASNLPFSKPLHSFQLAHPNYLLPYSMKPLQCRSPPSTLSFPRGLVYTQYVWDLFSSFQ